MIFGDFSGQCQEQRQFPPPLFGVPVSRPPPFLDPRPEPQAKSIGRAARPLVARICLTDSSFVEDSTSQMTSLDVPPHSPVSESRREHTNQERRRAPKPEVMLLSDMHR